MSTRSVIPAVLALLACPTARAADNHPPAAAASADKDAVQDVIFLADDRPIFIRLRLDAGGKGFRSAWVDAVKAIHAYLDRDGDGTLTRAEADRGGLPAMVRAATGGAAALPRADLDTSPRDGKVSLEELSDVLRPALGPFRVQVGQVATEKTDALFGHLDRDKDGSLSKDELAAAVSSLRRFDLDDDEMIGPGELDPFSNPMTMQYNDDSTRRGRYTAVPPVIELSADDSSFRPVRLLLKRYDRGNSSGVGADDNRLSLPEFGIDARDFKASDTDHDGALDSEELRRYLGRVRPDLEMSVTLPEDAKTSATIEVKGAGGKPLPPGLSVRRLSSSDVEIAVGEVNLEFHADGGERSVENAKSYYAGQFRAADTDNNKYLEKAELKDHGPFVATFDLMDRDGDGKLYMSEVDDFVERQGQAARSQMVLSTADQGRAIFAIMDTNRDRQLGAREVRGTVSRLSSWDRNGDGKVSANEVPHHYQLTIGRGQVTGMGMNTLAAQRMQPSNLDQPAAGPSWFKRMDRNKDGDVSRREFLGPRRDFDRLDVDRDGLLSAEEAAGSK